MLRKTLASALALALFGCQAGTDSNSTGNTQQLAAQAALAQYPRGLQASEELRAFAIIDPKDNGIRIANATDQALRDVQVWVNGSYMHHVDSIPAHRSLKLTPGDFFNSAGRSLADDRTAYHRVEVQTGPDRLYLLPSLIAD